MADTWTCEQCGTSFVRRREHGRFCSPPCRATAFLNLAVADAPSIADTIAQAGH